MTMLNTSNHQENANENHKEISITSTRSAKKRLTPPHVHEDVEKVELSYSAGGSVKRNHHMEKCLAVSYKIKHAFNP